MLVSLPQSSLRIVLNQPRLIKDCKTLLKARTPCKIEKVCRKKRGGCGEKMKRGVSQLRGEKLTPSCLSRCILNKEGEASIHVGG